MASTYTTVRYGSSGQQVRRLQQALNRAGYTLEVDGGFGEKTRAALLDYQRRCGLEADGVAGEKTWSSLAGQQSGSSTKSDTQRRLEELEKGYSPSRETEEARQSWQELLAQEPGAYESAYGGQMEELLRQLRERESFAYDPTEDAGYRNYEALYRRQGQAAMEDSMGQAAGLTGGYGSSYAQLAGQQSYQQYMRQLAELAPQLEELARQRYEQQGQALLEQYRLLQSQDEDAYAQWRDSVTDWQNAAQEARDRYDALSKQDVSQYLSMLNYYADRLKQEQSNALAREKLAASNQSGSSGGKSSSSGSKNTSKLSSVASESLEKTMKTYAEQGNTRHVKKLYQQYRERMTPTQKKRIRKLLSGYHIPMEQ